MEKDKFYEVNQKHLATTLLVLLGFLSLIFVFNLITFSIIGLIVNVFLALYAIKYFIKQNGKVRYIKFETKESRDYIGFYTSQKKLVIDDPIDSFIFHKPYGKIIEISHESQKKNLIIINKGNGSRILNFLTKEQKVNLSKPKKVSFWEVIELIFMP